MKVCKMSRDCHVLIIIACNYNSSFRECCNERIWNRRKKLEKHGIHDEFFKPNNVQNNFSKIFSNIIEKIKLLINYSNSNVKFIATWNIAWQSVINEYWCATTWHLQHQLSRNYLSYSAKSLHLDDAILHPFQFYAENRLRAQRNKMTIW